MDEPLDDIRFLEDGYGDDNPMPCEEPTGWDFHQAADRLRAVVMERDRLLLEVEHLADMADALQESRREVARLQLIEEALTRRVASLLDENRQSHEALLSTIAGIAKANKSRRPWDED